MTTADDVIKAISSRDVERRDWLLGAADAVVLIDALRRASGELERHVLCDALGRRRERMAVDVLIERLSDESPSVRSSAADALAKIKDPRAGVPLMQRFELPEPEVGVLRMLIAALGAVDYRPAIPTLIEWLACPDPSQRGSAAWSLGAMLAQEAVPALKEALRREHSDYPRQRMEEALWELRKARSASGQSE